MFQLTTATRRIAQLQKRIRAIQGGTSASKTILILLLLIHEAQSDTEPTLTSIVSESFPHLKRGVMRDFLAIMEAHRYFKAERWNKTDFIYTFETGSKIEFFSADQPSKVRGPRRDRLFINEANNVPFEAFEARLHKLAETEKLNEIPAIREFLDYMEREISTCKMLLSTDESLTDLQRSKLFAIIQVSEKYTHLFNGGALHNLEETIKRELDAAKPQANI